MEVDLKVWLLTENGAYTPEGELVKDLPFQGRKISSGSVHNKRIALIVDDVEVWLFADNRWRHLASSALALNCIAFSGDEHLLVGTAEARLARVTEEGIRFIESFDSIPERDEWNTPWGGPPDTRSLAVAADGTLLYANIHVGWIARSTDGGETWQCMRNGLEKDVHQVTAHPHDPDIVFAATARGFHISHDGGERFMQKPGNMPYLYQRACACFPENDTYLVSTSRGPHGQADALLYRSENGGDTWGVVKGLPGDIAENIDTYQITVLDSSRAFAAVNNTSLYASEDRGKNWIKIPAEFPKIFAAIVLAG